MGSVLDFSSSTINPFMFSLLEEIVFPVMDTCNPSIPVHLSVDTIRIQNNKVEEILTS